MYSTRALNKVVKYSIRGGIGASGNEYKIIDEGVLLAEPPETVQMTDFGVGSESGVITTLIPPEFFDPFISVTSGRAMLIVSIESASGTGSTDVGLFPDLTFWYQDFTDSPTMSPKPTTSHPSISALPSHHPTIRESSSPSNQPTISAAPTALKNATVNACQSEVTFPMPAECTNVPVDPNGNRRIAIYLTSEPQTFIYGKTLLTVLTQNGAEDYLIVSENEPIPNTDTVIQVSGVRRRIIETTVPEYFFDNPSEVLVVEGRSSILETGKQASSLEVEYSFDITLLSQPSDAPSEPPTVSSRPTFRGPTLRPTTSHSPTAFPSISSAPTDEQTIKMKSCPCDNQNTCLTEPITLTSIDRSIRVCVFASPSNSILKQLAAIVKEDKTIPLESKITENFGLITGELTDEDFLNLSPNGFIEVAGKTQIFVPQGNKGADVGFKIKYNLEASTEKPSSSPTSSFAPTDLPPLGVRICQCDMSNNCVENVVQTWKERSARMCILSTPPQSELVRIETFFFENANGLTQLVGDDDIETSNNPRLQIVQTELEEKFFLGDLSVLLEALGSARVKPVDEANLLMLSQRNEGDFKFELAMTIGEASTDRPSEMPTTRRPTATPSAEPTAKPTTVSVYKCFFISLCLDL